MNLKREAKGWWVFECTYDERNTAKAAGFWWNFGPYPKQWSCNKLDKAFLLRDFATPEDKSFLESEMAKVKSNLEASKATDSSISIPSPEGLEYLPFQKAGIAYALQRENTLIGDEMGLGKTIQAIGVINSTDPKTVLVVCPASLRLNWRNELDKWLTKSRPIYIVNSKDPIPADAEIVIVNYDRLDVAGLMDRNWDLLIVDECHKCKNPKALRTQRVLGSWDKKNKVRIPGLVDRSARKVFLTGTPVLNKPIELFPLVSTLDPKTFGNFWYFAKRYCGAYQGSYGWNMDGATNLEELQSKLRQSIMVRRLKSEVLTELPPKRRSVVVLPTNGASNAVQAENDAWSAQEESLNAVRDEVDLAWASGDESAYKAAIEKLHKAASVAFEEISKVRHATALAKVEAFTTYVEDALENTEKVIVFAHHKDVVAKLMEALKEYGPVKMTGTEGMEERQNAVDSFQNDPKVRVIIGTIGAMGVGWTLTASSTVLFAELDWVPANVTQAEDRAHRIGQTASVNIFHVVLDGSLDQRMAEVLIAKQDMADRALDKGLVMPDLNAKAPVIPGDNRGIQGRKSMFEQPAQFASYTKELKDTALEAMRYLAGVCDYAFTQDGMGFNKFDARNGHALASLDSLNDKQTWLALRYANKYRRQLSEALGDRFETLYKEVKKFEKKAKVA